MEKFLFITRCSQTSSARKRLVGLHPLLSPPPPPAAPLTAETWGGCVPDDDHRPKPSAGRRPVARRSKFAGRHRRSWGGYSGNEGCGCTIRPFGLDATFEVVRRGTNVRWQPYASVTTTATSRVTNGRRTPDARSVPTTAPSSSGATGGRVSRSFSAVRFGTPTSSENTGDIRVNAGMSALMQEMSALMQEMSALMQEMAALMRGRPR